MDFNPLEYDFAAQTIRRYRSGNRRFQQWIQPYISTPTKLVSDARKARSLNFSVPYVATVMPGEQLVVDPAGESISAYSAVVAELAKSQDQPSTDDIKYLVKPRLILLTHPAVQLAQRLLLSDLLEAVAPKIGEWKEVLGQGDRTLTSDLYLKDIRKVCDRIARSRRESKSAWVIKSDIRNFFPSIDRSQLRQILQEMSIPNELLDQVDFFLSRTIQFADPKFEVEWGEKLAQYREGVPLGLVLSPLLANLYLKNSAETLKGRNYYRFVDDCLFWGSSRTDAEALRFEFEGLLPSGLELHKPSGGSTAKSGTFGPTDSFEFLGLSVNSKGHLALPKKKLDRLCYRMINGVIQSRKEGAGAMDKFRKLQNFVDGCAGYYGPILKTSHQQRNRLDGIHRDLVKFVLTESRMTVESSSQQQRNERLGTPNFTQTLEKLGRSGRDVLASLSDDEINALIEEVMSGVAYESWES